MLLEKIAVSKGKSIFFTRESKFFRGGIFDALDGVAVALALVFS
jgi:hypothetical protein